MGNGDHREDSTSGLSRAGWCSVGLTSTAGSKRATLIFKSYALEHKAENVSFHVPGAGTNSNASVGDRRKIIAGF